MSEVLWTPPRDGSTAIERFMAERGFHDYEPLWRWSITELETFWAEVWDFCDVRAERGYDRILSSREMPGARWFEGARLSYAAHALRGSGPEAVVGVSQTRERVSFSW